MDGGRVSVGGVGNRGTWEGRRFTVGLWVVWWDVEGFGWEEGELCYDGLVAEWWMSFRW